MRHSFLRLLLIAAGLAAAAPQALAEPEATEPARISEPARHPDPDKRVCRTVKVTGSHLRQRVCFKQREWDRMRDDAQEAMRNAQPSYQTGEGPQ